MKPARTSFERRGLGAGPRCRVALCLGDLGFHQAVLDFLQRDHRLDVVAATSRPEGIAALASEAAADALVISSEVIANVLHPSVRQPGRALVVVCEEMTVPVLRDAIDAGAAGVFAWPEEREELAAALVRLPDAAHPQGTERGRVVAVAGARGGAGVTFLASHLAWAFAAAGVCTALVDADADHADMTIALGLASDEERRTVADLVPVATELSPQHVVDALHPHPAGFSSLLAPREALDRPVPPGLYTAAVALLAGDHQIVVVHLPRSLDGAARHLAAMADEIILVSTLDLFSLYGARRTMAALQPGGEADRCRLVINRSGREAVRPNGVARVLDVPVFASVRFDPKVKRVQGRGQLLSRRARAARDVRALARRMLSSAERQDQGVERSGDR